MTEVVFLQLGADPDSALYRVIANDDTPYFLKLRTRGAFAETTVEIPQFLHEQGIASTIAPMATTTGRLWTPLESFAVILSPFIEGRNGFEAPLSDRQWVELGAVLRGMHTAVLPLLLSEQIPREEYSPRWRDRVKEFQEDVIRRHPGEPLWYLLESEGSPQPGCGPQRSGFLAASPQLKTSASAASP